MDSFAYIPPMFIFPRKRLTPLLQKNGPAGALYKCSDNGWINENLFLEWLVHFKQHAKPSALEPILLILDNHASHISLTIYEYCKVNHIHMLSLPPHTSHRMQPLDVSFFGPLKMVYKKECDSFLTSHLAEKITPYDVTSLVRKAFINVASISKGESGFRACGIVPLNPEVFTEDDFMAAEILQSETYIIQDCNESHAMNPSTSMFELSPVSGSSSKVHMHDFIKLPEKTSAENTRKSRKQHATILTSTPIKEALIEKENKKMKKTEIWKGKGQGKLIQKKGAKRRLLQDDEDAEEKCLVCNDFGRKNEIWFRCTSCGSWAHAECTGWDSAEGYVCDIC